MRGCNGSADIEKRLGDTVEDGEGGKTWESSTETYSLPCVKLADGNVLYDAGSSNVMLCESLERWEGVGGGREV